MRKTMWDRHSGVLSKLRIPSPVFYTKAQPLRKSYFSAGCAGLGGSLGNNRQPCPLTPRQWLARHYRQWCGRTPARGASGPPGTVNLNRLQPDESTHGADRVRRAGLRRAGAARRPDAHRFSPAGLGAGMRPVLRTAAAAGPGPEPTTAPPGRNLSETGKSPTKWMKSQ